MRFAWQAKQSTGNADPAPSRNGRSSLIMVAYNVIWWVPIVLAFTPVMSYRAGFVAFLAVTTARLVANLYRNNVLSGERARDFPLRSP